MPDYNSQLQSNNTELHEIVQLLQNKAAGGGVELPELTNEGTAADLLLGKELIDGDGNKVTGTIVTKTASNLTASGATVTVPAGYYASQATKMVEPAAQATPSISVDSAGKITATATQPAGYVIAGTKSATKQLTTQAAKTITPTKSSQTAVASGVYTTGAVTVAAIPSQYITTTDATASASDILSGETAYVNGNKVTGNIGTYDGSYECSGESTGDGNGDTSGEDSLVTMDISTYTNSRVTSIGQGAFAWAGNLQSVSFPVATTIGSSAFYSCSKLTTASFPAVTTIGISAFAKCFNLTTISFPAATTIRGYAFTHCSKLTTISFPVATTIGADAFYMCSKLTTASFPAVTTISDWAFYDCSNLTTANFSAATTIGDYAFSECSSLTTVSFPVVTTIGSCAFAYCSKLTTISFPAATTIRGYAFTHCSKLTTVNFPVATNIGSEAFYMCYNLKSLCLTGSKVCTLSNSNAFHSTPIGGYSASAGTYGSIYVPASLLTSYQTATNWTYFSSRFVGI